MRRDIWLGGLAGLAGLIVGSWLTLIAVQFQNHRATAPVAGNGINSAPVAVAPVLPAVATPAPNPPAAPAPIPPAAPADAAGAAAAAPESKQPDDTAPAAAMQQAAPAIPAPQAAPPALAPQTVPAEPAPAVPQAALPLPAPDGAAAASAPSGPAPEATPPVAAPAPARTRPPGTIPIPIPKPVDAPHAEAPETTVKNVVMASAHPGKDELPQQAGLPQLDHSLPGQSPAEGNASGQAAPEAQGSVPLKTVPLVQPLAERGGVLTLAGKSLQLAGVLPTDPRRICTGPNGKDWPCGVIARTALRTFLRGRTIDCDMPDGKWQSGMTAACRYARTDLGDWLVRNGWAEPAPGSALFDASEEARRQLLGIYGNDPRKGLKSTLAPTPPPEDPLNPI